MKNLLRTGALSLIAAGLMALAPIAQAVPQTVDFEISSASLTIGSGYGIDANEKDGTLLDVRFTNLLSTSLSFSLGGANDARSFDLAQVIFSEHNNHSGIGAEETDNLDVLVTFMFMNPLGLSQSVSATGSATAGSVSDSDLDYKLTWVPIDVRFGDGGLFRISLDDLLFFDTGSQTQRATISLLSSPALVTEVDQEATTPVGAGTPTQTGPQNAPAAAVPEPATLALLGLGLAGLGALRRRQHKA